MKASNIQRQEKKKRERERIIKCAPVQQAERPWEPYRVGLLGNGFSG